MPEEPITLLFVYGSLKRGRTPQAAWLAERCRWLGPASIPGRLIDLGQYPALLPAALPSEVVHGELWELPANQDLLDELDRYEGCHRGDPPPHEYCRVAAVACDEQHSPRSCWAYLYPWGLGDFPVIPGGVW
jgi:gamma-glutamylcyclotransferase (GGCT)/AIG2-like uncharacterized protein YtfP